MDAFDHLIKEGYAFITPDNQRFVKNTIPAPQGYTRVNSRTAPMHWYSVEKNPPVPLHAKVTFLEFMRLVATGKPVHIIHENKSQRVSSVQIPMGSGTFSTTHHGIAKRVHIDVGGGRTTTFLINKDLIPVAIERPIAEEPS